MVDLYGTAGKMGIPRTLKDVMDTFYRQIVCKPVYFKHLLVLILPIRTSLGVQKLRKVKYCLKSIKISTVTPRKLLEICNFACNKSIKCIGLTFNEYLPKQSRIFSFSG